MLTERQNQIMGAVRNLLALAGGVAVAHGLANDGVWTAGTGFAVAALMALFSYRAHELTLASLLGVGRAGVAAVSAYFAFRGWDGADRIEQIAAGAFTLAPTIWSIYLHRPQALNTGEDGKGAAASGSGNVAMAFLAPIALAIVLALPLAGCTVPGGNILLQAAAGVAAADNALAGLAANSIPRACGIIEVAKGYFAELKPRISADKVRLEQQAEAIIAPICANPPANTAEALHTLFRMWLVIQDATKAS